ncbi:hypothetical protein AB0C87_25220 [Actinomadura sp. NPDC048021]
MNLLLGIDTTEMEEFWSSIDPRLAELFLLYTIPLIIGVVLPSKF